MSPKRSGIALATAAAALFATGAVFTPAVNASEGQEVKCAGINSCKGHSECNTATSECKGMNACKGQGWVHKASKQECEEAGGKVVEG